MAGQFMTITVFFHDEMLIVITSELHYPELLYPESNCRIIRKVTVGFGVMKRGPDLPAGL